MKMAGDQLRTEWRLPAYRGRQPPVPRLQAGVRGTLFRSTHVCTDSVPRTSILSKGQPTTPEILRSRAVGKTEKDDSHSVWANGNAPGHSRAMDLPWHEGAARLERLLARPLVPP